MTAPVSSYSVQQIIRMAYIDAGLIQETDEPNGDQYAIGLIRLNDVAVLMQTQGLKLWLMQDVSVTLVSGQSVYVLSPAGDVVMTKPTRVVYGYYLDSSGTNKRPLTSISWEEWTRLPPASTGQINSYFVDKKQTSLSVSTWPVPDATAAAGTMHLVVQNQMPQMVSLTAQHAFPMEWGMALRWMLADDMCTGQPQPVMDRCAARAAQFRTALEDWDVEDTSTYFSVDDRSGYGNHWPS